MENALLEKLSWRYAVKKFDASKKVSHEDLDIFLESLRLTASSFWLQPWKFVVVETRELKEKLLEHSYNQAQVVDASHLIVFCRRNTIDQSFVQEFFDDMIQKTWASEDSLAWYKNMILGFLSYMDDAQKKAWAEKQVYIALWNALASLAELKIDSCPMEWFSPQAYDEILWLTDEGLSSVVVLPIWYRSEDDTYASRDKIRYESEKLIVRK